MERRNLRTAIDTEPRIGDAVLLDDEHRTRGCRKKLKVVRINRRMGGKGRPVEILLANGEELERPASRLYLLKVGVDETQEKGDMKQQQDHQEAENGPTADNDILGQM